MEDDNKTVEFIDAKNEKTANRKANKSNIRDLLDGSLMTRELVVKNFRYLLLLTGFGLVLIANRFHAEKIVRETNDIQQKIKELRSESITVSSELMEMSRQSSVLVLVQKKGLELKELDKPAKKIVIDKTIQ
jgi:cell division protein FtsL